MKYIIASTAFCALLSLCAIPSHAQTVSAVVVASCGTPPVTYVAGQPYPQTQDTTGTLCATDPSAASGIVATAPETGVNGQQLSLALSPNGALRVDRDYSITPIVSTAAEASHQLCSAACEFVSVGITTGGTAGYLLLFNSTSVPSDGAVTPQACVPVAANSITSYSVSGEPTTYYSNGIEVVFSTTGCFMKTASATAFFSGKVQ